MLQVTRSTLTLDGDFVILGLSKELAFQLRINVKLMKTAFSGASKSVAYS